MCVECCENMEIKFFESLKKDTLENYWFKSMLMTMQRLAVILFTFKQRSQVFNFWQ